MNNLKEQEQKPSTIVHLPDGSLLDISQFCFTLFHVYSAEESATYLHRCVELLALTTAHLSHLTRLEVDEEQWTLLQFLKFTADALQESVFPEDL